VIGAANQTNWLRFAKTIDRPDLAADPRFRNNVERMRHFDELIAAVTPEIRKRSTQEWVATLDAAGVPVSPVLHVGDMHKDPQAIARGMIAEVTHSVLCPVKTLGNPLKFSKTPVELGAGRLCWVSIPARCCSPMATMPPKLTLSSPWERFNAPRPATRNRTSR